MLILILSTGKIRLHKKMIILLVLEIQRFKSVKACRPKSRQATVNANSSTNSLYNVRN
ncbi:MAG: hypothetical protein LBP59_12480 [Planctomycetaceae bacterium]|nr:hypothetical protein [Planctomycetaceae bacterium]